MLLSLKKIKAFIVIFTIILWIFIYKFNIQIFFKNIAHEYSMRIIYIFFYCEFYVTFTN